MLNKKVRDYQLSWATCLVCLMVCLVPTTRANAILTSSTLFSFDLTTNSGGVVESNGYLFGTLTNTSLSYGGAIYKVSVDGGQPEIIYQLNGDKDKDGYVPAAGLLVGSDGYLYGSTVYGSRKTVFNLKEGTGTLFRVSPDGVGFETLHKFDSSTVLTTNNLLSNSDGLYPSFPLIEDKNDPNTFYGVTTYGGTNGTGVIFSITSDGRFTKLFEFQNLLKDLDATNNNGNAWQNEKGAFPSGPLVFVEGCGTRGCLYGVTSAGGSNLYKTTDNSVTPASISYKGAGTVFKLDLSNNEVSLVRQFDSLSKSIGSDGRLTFSSGADSYGINQGTSPTNGLIELKDHPGVLVGTTLAGGVPSECHAETSTNKRVCNPVSEFSSDTTDENAGLGVVYKIDTNQDDQFDVLHYFDSSVEKNSALGKVVDIGGKLYGLFLSSSPGSYGTVFSIDLDKDNAYDIVLENDNNLSYPNSGILLSESNANYFYGTTSAYGGSCGFGNVYRLSFDSAAPPVSSYSNCYTAASPNSGGGSMDKGWLCVLLGLVALASLRRRVFGFSSV